MKTKAFYYILSLLTLLLVSSCLSSKEIVYFQDEPIGQLQDMATNPVVTYKPNDILNINVSALDPKTVAPFNLPVIPSNNSALSMQGSLKLQTYLIDNQGHIEFPVIGTIKLGGLTRQEATQFLKNKISEYVNEPIINIRLINFTITVLGEVNSPGTFTIEDERVSLSEALGLAGDLTIYGRRNNVFLIREQDGKKRFAKFDLTKISVVNSSNYYLEQNDVIYVEPNSAKVRAASYNQNNAVVISAIGTLATIIAILLN